MRWISTQTRNPKFEDEYLCTVKIDCVFGKRTYVDLVTYGLDYGWHLRTNDYNVLAWCRKPEPYREVTHDQSGL